jgi:hypothetical protein
MSDPRRRASITLPAHEDLQAWLALQRETTERVHPSWFPGLPAELIVHARKSPPGRRWLANRLARVSPLLFGIPHETEAVPARNLRNAEWLRICLHDVLECALDLGSLTLAVTVRTMVTRSEVMRLRAVLGVERYERLLFAPPSTSSASAPAAFRAGAHGTAECRGDDLAERLLRCGAHELAAYAATLHPALCESVRLSLECNWWDVEGMASLTPAAVESCLRLRRERQKDAAYSDTDTEA